LRPEILLVWDGRQLLGRNEPGCSFQAGPNLLTPQQIVSDAVVVDPASCHDGDLSARAARVR
jgi:hypothetical protein